MTVENGKAEEKLQSAEEVVIEKEMPEQAQQEAVEQESVEQVQDDTSDLLQKIEELTVALEKAKDQALRAQADAQNTKRRAEMDVEKSAQICSG